MENKILLDLNLYKIILDKQASTLVGKVCKRFEISDDKEAIKKNIKELIYEEFRMIYETLLNGKIIFEFQSKDNQKSEGKNGPD